MIKNLSLFFLQYVALELDSKYSVLNGARACSVPQSCLTLGDPLTVVHQAPLSIGILQARIPKWVAMPSSRGSSRPRDRTYISCVFCFGRQILHHCTTWEALIGSWV